jgi:hypothetical protein
MSIFEMTIQHKTGDGWPISVRYQPGPDALAQWRSDTLVLDQKRLKSLLPSQKEYGLLLGKALFKTKLRDAFVGADSAASTSHEPLHVLLTIEGSDLRDLHWEQLCAPLDRDWDHLLLNQRTPFSLNLRSGAKRDFPPIGPHDLNALILVAGPDDLDDDFGLEPFDVSTTVSSIKAALSGTPSKVIASVPGSIGPPTLNALIGHLTVGTSTGKYTLLHIVCHGKVVADPGETVLYFPEDESGRPVWATTLIERLSRLKDLPYLTFLSTCESADPRAEAGLGGVGHRLVRELGIPAVVAMTDTITIETAEALASTFYARLREHGQVDIALSEALAGLQGRYDVTVPALFGRLEGGPLFSAAPPAVEGRAARHRRRTLELVENIWVRDALDQKLHGVAMMGLDMEERADAVPRPFNADIQMPGAPRHQLPRSTRIVDVFDGTKNSLLILGAPGAGKTVTLLELTRQTIHRARRDPTQPIPVVFHLSSWAAKKGSIADWLVEELKTKYYIPREVARSWVEDDELLLLLDGLDEVEAKAREDCVRALNAFREEHMVQMAVCSRTAEFEALNTPLKLGGAYLLQPLTPEQIDQYLRRAGPELEAVRNTMQDDPVLRKEAETPLMVAIIAQAYHGTPAEELGSFDTPEERRKDLFDRYIQRRLHGIAPDHPYTPEDTIGWLAWLAVQMRDHGQSIFLIERLQFDWLPPAQRSLLVKRLAWGLGLVFALILLAMWSLIPTEGQSDSGLFQLLRDRGWWVVTALFTGIFSGWLIWSEWKIELPPLRSARWVGFGPLLRWLKSWPKYPVRLFVGTVIFLIISLSIGLTLYADHVWEASLLPPLGAGLVVAGFVLLIGAVQSAIEPAEIATTTVPNQGIRQSARMAPLAFLGTGIATALILGLGLLVFTSLHSDGTPSEGKWFSMLRISVWLALDAGLVFGGLAALLHTVLRLQLWHNGSIPWRYADFLDHAAQLTFLHKVGGAYIFVHRRLMDHFASLYQEPSHE